MQFYPYRERRIMYNLNQSVEEAPIKLFTSLFINTLSLDDYKIDYDSIANHNGEIIAQGWLNSNDIDHAKGLDQTRASDYDKGHLTTLTSQIEADGLSHLPLVEWDPSTEKFIVLSGHHRVKALCNIAAANDQEDALIPVAVLRFPDVFKKRFWLQVENKHEAAKAHTKNDAIKFICDLRADNYQDWNTRTDENKIKTEVYAALKRAGYTYGGKHRKDIFCSAWNDTARDTIRNIAAANAKSLATAIFNQSNHDTWIKSKSDPQGSQEYIISTGQDASRKCLHIAAQELANSIFKSGMSAYQAPLSKLKAFIYFPAAYKEFKDLKKQREDFIQQQTVNNLVYFSAVNMVVSEIVFPPQFKGKKKSQTEEDYIKYGWDFKFKRYRLKK